MLKRRMSRLLVILLKKNPAEKVWLQLQYIKSIVYLMVDILKFVSFKYFPGKKIIMLCTQTHGNMGDQAIGIAQLRWLKDNFPDYKLIEITEPKLRQYKFARLNYLNQMLHPADIIFMQGGGDLGDRYSSPEECRRKVIALCKQNPIIIFPKTICFSNTIEGRQQEDISQQIYNSHPNIILTLRDSTSYQLAQKLFPKNRLMLIPDIVLYLSDYKTGVGVRNGILLCFRRDVEGYYSQSEKESLQHNLEIEYSTVHEQDTVLNKHIHPKQREIELQTILKCFASHKVVVTDRFHGVVFSVITRTPCIVIRSLDHKIISGVKWFEHLNFVFFAQSPDEVPLLVQKALQLDILDKTDFNIYFDKLRQEIDANMPIV